VSKVAPTAGQSGPEPVLNGTGATDARARARGLGHDLRNALNGASVNIEAARGRAEREGTLPGDLTPFLTRAAGQIDAASTITRAIFALMNEVLDSQSGPAAPPTSTTT
jgi:hypothetical protein